jgi:hypothetical protein
LITIARWTSESACNPRVATCTVVLHVEQSTVSYKSKTTESFRETEDFRNLRETTLLMCGRHQVVRARALDGQLYIRCCVQQMLTNVRNNAQHARSCHTCASRNRDGRKFARERQAVAAHCFHTISTNTLKLFASTCTYELEPLLFEMAHLTCASLLYRDIFKLVC